MCDRNNYKGKACIFQVDGGGNLCVCVRTGLRDDQDHTGDLR